MLHRKSFAITLLLLSSLLASGRDKKKALLPADILQAKTVLVVVDPNAGVDVRDPNANRLARVAVEQALTKWGRLSPVNEGYTADLVITVRRGDGQTARSTIGGTPVNGTPPVGIGSTTTPTSQTTNAGGRWGTTGVPGDPSNTQNPSTPYPQLEVGSSQDTFVVYRGGPNPLDGPAVWRYTAKDALASPGVPAVEAFRKLVADSEKQLATGP
jgi:hypothetical protein